MIEPLNVAMSRDSYEQIPIKHRAEAWSILIRKAGVTGPYLPIPFSDESRDIVGMNIIRLKEMDIVPPVVEE